MITRRGKTWWLDIWVGHGKARKRVRRSLHTDEKPLALERARDLASELQRGRPAGGVTLADFVSRYLAWARDTKVSYRSERYQVPVIQKWFESHGAKTLKAITPYLIEQFRMDVCARNRLSTKTPKGNARSTANKYCALLRVMLYRAKDWGMLDGPNPASKVKPYKETDEKIILSDTEKDALLAAAEKIKAEADPRSPVQHILSDFLSFLFATGLRKNEAVNLKWSALRDTSIDILGKGGKRRTVPLNAAAQAVLARQPRLSAFVFDLSNRHQDQLFNPTLRRLRKLSGVSRFHLHLCRHWFTVALLRAGVDIKTVGDILGHSRMQTTLIYAHSTPESRQAAVDAIDTKLGHNTVSCNRGDSDISLIIQ